MSFRISKLPYSSGSIWRARVPSDFRHLTLYTAHYEFAVTKNILCQFPIETNQNNTLWKKVAKVYSATFLSLLLYTV